MVTKEGIRLKSRRYYVATTARIRKKELNNTDFTIISNNCWGGLIYQSYALPYQSPTAGLFFMADDYIKFLRDLKGYINSPLTFISCDESKWKEEMKKHNFWGTYPVGKIKDIEIFFLHYQSKEEAAEKWMRRCERINWDRMLIKFNDQNGCTEEHLKEFASLKYPNKVCFTCKKYPYITNIIYIDSSKKHNVIKASYEPFGRSRHIDITKLLNNLQGSSWYSD